MPGSSPAVDVASTARVAVVLVHGGFVDGSGWGDVCRISEKDGYEVNIVWNPTSTRSCGMRADDQKSQFCHETDDVG